MPDLTVGERIASLEAEFKSFRYEMLKDNAYIKEKLDKIAEGLTNKVNRPDCQERHERLGDRIRALEQKTPAIVQTIAVALTTGLVMVIATYLIEHLP